MGEGYGYICKKCKKEKSILYGIGFLGYKEHYTDNNFNELVEIGKEEKLKNLENLRKFLELENVDLKDGYGYDAYICPKCDFIDNKFRYILYSDNKKFIPKYSCKYCGNDLRIKHSKEDFKLLCDFCGSKDFEAKPYLINWD